MQDRFQDYESKHIGWGFITLVYYPNHLKSMVFRPNETEGEGVNFNDTIYKQYLLQYSHGVHLSSSQIIERENIMQDCFHDEESEHIDLDYITSIVSHPNHQK